MPAFRIITSRRGRVVRRSFEAVWIEEREVRSRFEEENVIRDAVLLLL
jgi:hypothetical protein